VNGSVNGYKNVGEFQIESGEVLVTDPCYSVGTWCQAKVANVKNGTWEALINYDGRKGERVSDIVVLEKKHRNAMNNAGNFKWQWQREEVGVDSGQAGIFDLKYFKDDKSVDGMKAASWYYKSSKNEKGEFWYCVCCHMTLAHPTESDSYGGGAIPYGAVASSGYGDGGYRFATVQDKTGRVVGIRIEFIEDEKDENNNEDYDEDCDEDNNEDL
jgi:hypothetical protein